MNIMRSSSGSAILRTSNLPTTGPYPTLDPFLFCVYHNDEYPPDESKGKMETLFPGNGSDFNPSVPYRMYHGHKVPGFPQHPHRGFETITATMNGLIDHADSMGNAGRYGEGDVQWMTAGKGIVHGEMFPLVHSHKDNALRLFQIWLNLPSKSKMVRPSFAMFWSENVPVWESDDGGSSKASVAVWAGDYFLGSSRQNQNTPPPDSWAADPENDVAVLHIKVPPGGKVTVPKANKDGVNRTMYLIEKSHGNNCQVKFDGTVIDGKVYLELDATKDVLLEVSNNNTNDNHGTSSQQATTSTEFLLLQGKPINEPVAQHGPFVMNTRSEIQDAFLDYQRTQFGGWPWPRDDMIFAQDKGRFALIDGKEIRPTSFHGGSRKREEMEEL